MNQEEKNEINEQLTKKYMHIQSLYNDLADGQICWPAISDSFDWGRITEQEMREEITSILQYTQKTYIRK